MITSISPQTKNVNEYEPFVFTFTVSYDVESVNPEIYSVTVDTEFTPYVNIDIVNAFDFTISGQLGDVFNREISFIQPNEMFGVVSRWVDVPPDFETVYKYVGSSEQTRIVDINVQTSEGSIIAQITVANNWEYSNAQLVTYVNSGVY